MARAEYVTLAPGIYKDGTGISVIARVGAHGFKEARCEPGTSLRKLKEKQDELRVQLRKDTPTPLPRVALGRDIDRYLPTITDKAARRDSRILLNHFRLRFERISRSAITAVDLKQQRAAWLDAGVAISTVNKRLMAFRALCRTLGGPNPAADIPKMKEPDTTPRAIDYPTLLKILALMPDRGHPVAHQKRPTVNLAKLRCAVLIWTGLPPVTMQRVRPAVDLQLDADPPIMRLRPRRKGKGAPEVWVELLPQAVEAWRAYLATGKADAFSTGVVRKAWQGACTRLRDDQIEEKASDILRADVTLYDIRHSFLTALAKASKDERAVQEAAQHADIRTTRRYTEGSVPPRVRVAMASMREWLGQTVGTAETPVKSAS